MAYEYKGPVAYFEQIVPASVSYSRLAIAGDAERPYAATFCARSQDNPHGCIAGTFIAIHDSKSPTASAWPLYTEGWARKGSHPEGVVVAEELAIIEQRDACIDIDPFHITRYGQTNGQRIGIGKPEANGGEVSAFAAWLSAETTGKALARMGLVIGALALKLYDGIGRAINLARNHAIVWWSMHGPVSMIVCDTGSPDMKVAIRLGNGAIHFEDPKGQSQFSFNLLNGVFYMGANAVGPNGTLYFWAGGRRYAVKATPA